jgi:predicted NAD/FAD-binding protein
MRIAVIGSGISGMVADYHLSREHDVTVYESGAHIGGHTNTVDVEYQGPRVCGRYRVHCLQRVDVSQFYPAARQARSTLATEPHELQRTVREKRARVQRANEALLHTDSSLMPRRPLAWAAWNYHLPISQSGRCRA